MELIDLQRRAKALGLRLRKRHAGMFRLSGPVKIRGNLRIYTYGTPLLDEIAKLLDNEGAHWKSWIEVLEQD